MPSPFPSRPSSSIEVALADDEIVELDADDLAEELADEPASEPVPSLRIATPAAFEPPPPEAFRGPSASRPGISPRQPQRSAPGFRTSPSPFASLATELLQASRRSSGSFRAPARLPLPLPPPVPGIPIAWDNPDDPDKTTKRGAVSAVAATAAAGIADADEWEAFVSFAASPVASEATSRTSRPSVPSVPSSPPRAFARTLPPDVPFDGPAVAVRPPSVPDRTLPRRSRAWWMLAAALGGALVAGVGVRVAFRAPAGAASPAHALPTVATSLVAAAPLAPAAPVANPAPSVVLASPSTRPSVVRFDDADAIAIGTPAPSASAKREAALLAPPSRSPTGGPAPSAPNPPRPAALARSGSGGTPAASASTTSSVSTGRSTGSASVAVPARPPKRLTPEQELAEAQLRASMR